MLQEDAPARIEPSPWYRRQQVADRLQCSLRHVDDLIAAGQLKAYRSGRLVRIHVDDVDAHLRSGSGAAA